MNDVIRAVYVSCESLSVREICFDDLGRQVFQPADSVAAGTNETADMKTEANKLFDRVAADKPRTSCDRDRRNGKSPFIDIAYLFKYIEKNFDKQKKLDAAHEVSLKMGDDVGPFREV